MNEQPQGPEGFNPNPVRVHVPGAGDITICIHKYINIYIYMYNNIYIYISHKVVPEVYHEVLWYEGNLFPC